MINSKVNNYFFTFQYLKYDKKILMVMKIKFMNTRITHLIIIMINKAFKKYKKLVLKIQQIIKMQKNLYQHNLMNRRSKNKRIMK